MPRVVVHKLNGASEQGEVDANTNLVVLAGIRKFPYPHLRYGCGMGKCTKCKARILGGADALPAPNWKERKLLGEELNEGFRLMCQIWIVDDIELRQERRAKDEG